MDVKQMIDESWNKRELLKDNKYAESVRKVIEEVDKGRLRVAEPSATGWQVNEWVKQAILRPYLPFRELGVLVVRRYLCQLRAKIFDHTNCIYRGCGAGHRAH